MLPARRSIRLPDYDYTQAGAYFVTLVTARRANLFGEILNGDMRLNLAGQIAKQEWIRLAERFEGLALDEYVIMPNHLHGILWLNGAEGVASSSDDAANRSQRSLGTLIGSYKSSSTRLIRAAERSVEKAIWQRNYYEHILRSTRDLEHARKYIHDNPLRWYQDQENPNRE